MAGPGSISVIVAGTSFPAIPKFLSAALPEMHLEMVELEALKIGGFAAQVLIPAMAPIDGALMDKIAGLRLIHQWGAGLEGVDIAAASARSIAVANVPTAGTGNAESVAEWCVMAAIAVSRRLAQARHNLRTGADWGAPEGRVLFNRRAGIVGLGGIGQALALRLRPFGMRLMGLQRSPNPALAKALDLEWLGGPAQLPELLARSDYLFLCLPQTEDSRGLIDERALALLPPQACIINPARGGLIDAAALLAALRQGRLMGAAMDVFEREPLAVDSPLAAHPEILATPHIAGVTDLSYSGIAAALAANIRRLSAGQALENCVNPSALTP
ncbi:MAG TPA: NAD(P)-dependent oxidoreductase [Candidatus Binataceae bacterium]|nr:NAD(P)-dependent oxidoreductase [Candidatus Binataceae bacterium]